MATHDESPVSLPMAESPPPPPLSSASQKLRCDAIINAYTPSQNAGASAHAQVCAQVDPRSGHSVTLSAGSPAPHVVTASPRGSPQKSCWYMVFIGRETGVFNHCSEQEALQRYMDYMQDWEGLEVQQLVDDTTHLMMTHH
ncbi:hypothetical protein BS47DRAFT_1360985 [Hydnum rufescens UP504]|uniref:Uncharacterized protein n=1 Tax=Hydnum rufescens UP504 TaxID=1448309 RepID=A0A9P6B0S5_9AGAM|nr:hypothetical protein BS47DRAFT_1360985 [Hydnum rufescens UP504]